jgi:hypothetical protein
VRHMILHVKESNYDAESRVFAVFDSASGRFLSRDKPQRLPQRLPSSPTHYRLPIAATFTHEFQTAFLGYTVYPP